jgi:uncharacterized protein YyaL (SSP411 family)
MQLHDYRALCSLMTKSHTNRLIHESSPYLRQHAHNPVDWYPWGDEAFEKAKRESKPIFLSIGYSTCHWCHVMEHESFANKDIADYLNKHFVSIKLDREERPDLDEIYMTGVQIISGQGGWPMSNFLNAKGQPFFAGTYFPPENFQALLMQLSEAWVNRHDEVKEQAEKISRSIQEFTSAQQGADLLQDDLESLVAEESLARLDKENGGFGAAPKFPSESQLLLTLSNYERNDDVGSLDAVVLSLDKMCQGGIYDQTAGGFHRYTVDAAWLVPHFEKMLYNQAQLIRVYGQAYRVTNTPSYRRIVTQTIDYLVRDMMNDKGLFYAATDADSEGVEGKFFVWSEYELRECLSEADFTLVKILYDTSPEGNFEGSNILNLGKSLEDSANEMEIEIDDLLGELNRIHHVLYQQRERRVHPLRDEKIITSWNAMLVNALVLASDQIVEPQYLEIAIRAAERLWELAYLEGQLWRISVNEVVSIPGNQEDFAYFSECLMTLYHHTGEDKWLQRGRLLIMQMIELFWDELDGGFFLSLANDAGPLITRPKSPMDGAMPSGNSVALSALVLLFEAEGDLKIEFTINKMMRTFSSLLNDRSTAFSYMILGIERKRLGAMSARQFCAQGKIKLGLVRHDDVYILSLDIIDGWHINAARVDGSNPDAASLSGEARFELIPTFVHSDNDVEYPATTSALNKGHYEGHVEFVISAPASNLWISFQACNNAICLAPETINLPQAFAF